MAKATYPGPPEALAQYEALVDRLPEVERKGAKNPYTSLNGHMFSFLTPEGGLAIRLSDELRDAFDSEYGAEPVIQYNSVMNGYVAVPDELFADLDAAQSWLEASRDWISSIPQKPTKKN